MVISAKQPGSTEFTLGDHGSLAANPGLRWGPGSALRGDWPDQQLGPRKFGRRGFSKCKRKGPLPPEAAKGERLVFKNLFEPLLATDEQQPPGDGSTPLVPFRSYDGRQLPGVFARASGSLRPLQAVCSKVDPKINYEILSISVFFFFLLLEPVPLELKLSLGKSSRLCSENG